MIENISVLLSGGVGKRFGGQIAKQYRMLYGRPVIEYSIKAIFASKLSEKLLIVTQENIKGIECIEGGNTRNRSLFKAICHIDNQYPTCKRIFIHEAARPFLTPEIVNEYFCLLAEYDAVITAKSITDSLGQLGQHVTNRDEYYLIAAPEAFRFPLLRTHFDADSNITATVQQLPFQARVKRYYDFPCNMKITYPQDLMVAEQLMKGYQKKYE